MERRAATVPSGDIVSHSTRRGAEFFSEQEREKSVFPAAALMRFEEELDEEAVHTCGRHVAGGDDGERSDHRHHDDRSRWRDSPDRAEYRTRIKSYVTEHKI